MELPQYLAEQIRNEVYKIEEKDKMPYVTSFERLAKAEGKELGLVEGKEIGFVEGIEIGIEKGVIQGKLEVARKLMASGFSAEQAASIADVPVALLQSS